MRARRKCAHIGACHRKVDMATAADYRSLVENVLCDERAAEVVMVPAIRSLSHRCLGIPAHKEWHASCLAWRRAEHIRRKPTNSHNRKVDEFSDIWNRPVDGQEQMTTYSIVLGRERHVFQDLKSVLACASPLKSGDVLAGIAASSNERRVAARYLLADMPLKNFPGRPRHPIRDRRGQSADRRPP